MKNNIVKFLKSKDFRLLGELGRGACGKTVKLYDEEIKETFVCKKYEPFQGIHKEELFDNFIQEIKLLYLLNHRNVVRVFTYYIYREHLTGYILMEHVEGNDIERYLTDNPEKINEIFTQCVSGFLHLEKCKVLHRDIRPLNILVSKDGEVKIIDFGFGKQANNLSDFDKSISLNWWCEPPSDFSNQKYDFCTEVYFVGKLFEKIIKEQNIGVFKYVGLLNKMCQIEPVNRMQSFAEVSSAINEEKFVNIEFNSNELLIYRDFSQSLDNVISKIETDCSYFDDSVLIQKKLEDLYSNVMLEEYVPSNNLVARCFLNGSYYYSKKSFFLVSELKSFIEFMRSCSKDKKNIIINNLYTRLDTIIRYSEPPIGFNDDVPF
jgi:eukaryotic-like serine/threonine-protein kinase